MQQCLACGGTYNPVQADGTAYYHTCPVLSAYEIAAAVAAGSLILPAGVTAAAAAGSGQYVRAGARDERVTGPSPGKGQPAPIVSAGAGVQTVATAPAPTPIPVTVPVKLQPAAAAAP